MKDADTEKEVIDLLKKAKQKGRFATLEIALDNIDKALAKLQALPRYETPEQYEERTGNKWRDWDAVYARYVWNYPRWRAMSYSEAKEGRYYERSCPFDITHIVIATEDGCPPWEWVPEEDA